jgi:hypothetical protein
MEVDFDSRVKDHMAEYKRSVLKINQDGIWKRNKRSYKHILPEESWQANILEPYREAFFNAPQAKIQFHNDFHHLISSQAMCINFFYPLIAEERLHLLLPILGMDQTAKDCITEACFEKESYLEVVSSFKKPVLPPLKGRLICNYTHLFFLGNCSFYTLPHMVFVRN